MRSSYKGKGNGRISEDRILRLEKIGFKWDLRVHYAVKEEAPVFALDHSDDDFMVDSNPIRIHPLHKAQSLLLLQNLTTPKSAHHLALFLIAMRQKTLFTLVHRRKLGQRKERMRLL